MHVDANAVGRGDGVTYKQERFGGREARDLVVGISALVGADDAVDLALRVGKQARGVLLGAGFQGVGIVLGGGLEVVGVVLRHGGRLG